MHENQVNLNEVAQPNEHTSQTLQPEQGLAGDENDRHPMSASLLFEFFTTCGRSNRLIDIRFSRYFYGDDGRALGNKYADFPVIHRIEKVAMSDGRDADASVFYALAGMKFALGDEPFLPRVGDEILFAYQDDHYGSQSWRKVMSSHQIEEFWEGTGKKVFVRIVMIPYHFTVEPEEMY